MSDPLDSLRPVASPFPVDPGTDGAPLFLVIRRTLLRNSVSDEDDELARLLADVVLAWQEQDRAEAVAVAEVRPARR
jgi:hypothetical protein